MDTWKRRTICTKSCTIRQYIIIYLRWPFWSCENVLWMYIGIHIFTPLPLHHVFWFFTLSTSSLRFSFSLRSLFYEAPYDVASTINYSKSHWRLVSWQPHVQANIPSLAVPITTQGHQLCVQFWPGSPSWSGDEMAPGALYGHFTDTRWACSSMWRHPRWLCSNLPMSQGTL